MIAVGARRADLQQRVAAARAVLELVVQLAELPLHDPGHHRPEVLGRQFQAGFGIAAGALDHRARVAHDLEHRDVFRQRVDHDGVDAPVARAQHRVVEQARAVAAAAAAHGHRDAELGRAGALRVGVDRGFVGQVRQRDQVQPAVEHAEDLVALERDALHVAADLVVGRRVAEAQVAVVHVQRQQVGQDARPVARRQRADRHPAERARAGDRQRGGPGLLVRAAPGLAGGDVRLRIVGRGVAGKAHDELPKCLPGSLYTHCAQEERENGALQHFCCAGRRAQSSRVSGGARRLPGRRARVAERGWSNGRICAILVGFPFCGGVTTPGGIPGRPWGRPRLRGSAEDVGFDPVREVAIHEQRRECRERARSRRTAAFSLCIESHS